MSRSPTDGDHPAVALLRLRRLTEQFRQSLFYLPALFVGASIASALIFVRVDRATADGTLPDVFSTTVDNARSILSTVAGGTITAASIVFSLTLVAVQLASSQFSPRVVRGFLGDRLQQIVMGVVVGTFSYCLLVLRVVQATGEGDETDPFLPRLSVIVGVLLGVASLLAVLASIDHTAKSLRVGSLLDRIADETVDVIERRHLDDRSLHFDSPDARPIDPAERATADHLEVPTPPSSAVVVRSDRTGWVTQMSTGGLLDALPDGGTLLLDASVGAYVIEGERLGVAWPGVESSALDGIRNAIDINDARTLQQDVAFGILQLNDVAMRALSPGVNDPNTAIESVHRVGRVLAALFEAGPMRDRVSDGGRTVVRSWSPDVSDYVEAAVGPIRRYGAGDVTVLEAIVRMLVVVRDVASAEREVPVDLSAVERQFDLIEAQADEIPTEVDRARLERALAAARRGVDDDG